MTAWELEGARSPSCGRVIDRPSVKSSESGEVCGYDSGKKIKGRSVILVPTRLV
jgi:hypothetical protein